MLHALIARARALFTPAALEKDINDEIDGHIARDTEELIAGGLAPAQAAAEARRRFGNVTLDRESARAAYGWTWPSQVFQDARYAIRALVRTPAFTAVAVVSLGLAIGANATIFSAIDALLLRPLPVDKPERLVTLEQAGPADTRSPNLAFGDYDRFRALDVFSGAAAVTWADAFNISARGADDGVDPHQVRVSIVTGNFFGVLGVRPRIGRLLAEDDDRVEGGHPVVVISDDYWARRFARVPTAVGSSLTILDTTYTIIGIAPPAFRGEWVGWPTDLWVPVAMVNKVLGLPPSPGASRGGRLQYKVLARLAGDVSQASAEAAARGLRDRIAAEAPAGSGIVKNWSFVLMSAATGYSAQRAEFRQPLMLLMGIVAALLLVACANVTSLLLARGAARQAELAVRAAIGASRARLIRQLLTESTILAVLGGLIGVVLAYGGSASMGSIASSGPAGSVQWGAASVVLDMTPNTRVILFTAVACAGATLLFGLLPAIRTARRSSNHALIGHAVGSRITSEGAHLRAGLVIAQIAITLVLLCSAALFVRSIHNLRSEHLGFDRTHLLLAWILPGYRDVERAGLLAKMAAVQQRVAEVPGVASVSASVNGMFSGSPGASPRMRRDGESDADSVLADDGRFIGPGYFRTVGQHLVQGRDFRDSDGDHAPKVMIVDESFSRRMFGGSNAVGRRLLVGGTGAVPYEIVGVVANAKYSAPRATAWTTVYLPFAQARNLRRACLVVRTEGNPVEMARRLRQGLAAVDPQLPILDIDTVSEQMDRVLFRERLMERLATVFAGIALMLACLGLYGVTSFLANRRSREIGIRMALGARPIAVLRLIAGQSLWLVAGGIVLGIAGAVAVRHVLASHLYGISAVDPMTIAGVATVMTLAGLPAACLPAMRVARKPPVEALRAE